MFDINSSYVVRNQFFVEDSLPRYLALALFKSMYPQLNSCRVSDHENQWGEVCSIATRLLNTFDVDNVHLIRRMDDQTVNEQYNERIIKVGMYDNWDVLSHDVRIPTRYSYNDYEQQMLDYAKVGVATEFVRRFMSVNND